ncbi:MAG: hypothetical protein JW857_09690 [Bacteroidales bacterium]|nr:hypothetical protein [Bacteroidales bacterium]
MKTKILKISATSLLLAILSLLLMAAGCEKDNGVWIQIEPINPNEQISEKLDSIFSRDNNCLLNFEKDTLFHTIFSYADFNAIDTCNTVLEIDFDKYTLVTGKVMVPEMTYSISGITLTYNNASDVYKLEVSIDKCEECYTVIDYLYFWRLYPKLNSKYKIEILLTEK